MMKAAKPKLQMIRATEIVAGDRIFLLGEFYLVDRIDPMDSPLSNRVAVVNGEPWMSVGGRGCLWIMPRQP